MDSDPRGNRQAGASFLRVLRELAELQGIADAETDSGMGTSALTGLQEVELLVQAEEEGLGGVVNGSGVVNMRPTVQLEELSAARQAVEGRAKPTDVHAKLCDRVLAHLQCLRDAMATCQASKTHGMASASMDHIGQGVQKLCA